ncbi:hypothetical protein PSTG_04318 [Puccinia striiformis f. sp. tritici PST-78]|uniref:Uncharacterized protein n=1 Tax=Puccinia striiformis f. sp. tritici PST-78 TaxID=1165861 RepID=A0A0L0VT19_9BASI|nr:hypothetical protein PSTG_04318 [Puccinia striiformis f. sp. tritici PST-78]
MDSSKSYALLDIDPPAIMTRRKALLISVASCDHAQLERRYEVGSGRDSQHTWIPSFKKSHFGDANKPQEPNPTPFHEALQPLVDIATEAYPIIQRDSYREAEIELFLILAGTCAAPTSDYQCSESSSCASSIMSSRPPSLMDSLKSWWRFT